MEDHANKMVAAVQQVLANPEKARQRGLALQQLVRERHNPEIYWETAQKSSSFFKA